MRMLFTKKMFLILTALTISVGAFAQHHSIKGSVKSENGESVIGAAVTIEGSSTGTSTDMDGNYSLSGVNANSVIEISYIGYETQTITVGSKSTIDVILVEDKYDLEEVVVIGYGSVRKKEITGAVANVNAEDIGRIVTSDLGTALQGQVAGVSITSSGSPGGSSEILIRGVSSISGANTPLYVVDGIPQNGDPRISTNEIETIDILKDAASCAIYGTRGAAGVILITTKQGEAGDMKISFNSSYGIQNIRSSMDLMNAEQQNFFTYVQARNQQDSYDDDVILDAAKYTTTFQNNTDLSRHVFVNNAPIQNYNLNVSGGKGGFTYNISTGFYDQTGVIVNSQYQKLNTRINTGYKSDKWKITASAGFQTEDRDQAPGSLFIQTIKYLPTQDDLDWESSDPYVSAGGDSGTRLGWVLNSFHNQDNTKSTRAFGNLGINYNILDNLMFSTNLGLSRSNSYRHQFTPFFEAYDYLGQSLTNPEDSSVTMTATIGSSLTWDGGLNYNLKFGKHAFTLYGGVSIEEYTYDGFVASKDGVLDNSITVLGGASINDSASSLNNYKSTLVGTIARLQYNWNSRYMLSASVRADGSSKFASSNRWGVFPSASAAWNIADESFMKPIKNVMNNFKLRASYGTTGNQSFNSYAFASAIENGYDTAFGNSTGSSDLAVGSIQTAYANADVKWETTIQSNIGIDMGFFGNKLTVVAEYYNTKKRDMLFPVTLPGSTGASGGSVTMNVGNMTNKGYELAIGYNGKIGKKFNWSAQGTFGTNENIITEMFADGIVATKDSGLISGQQTTSQVIFLSEGYEAGAFFLYTTDGIADTQEKLADYQQVYPGAKMGDLIYKDNNHDNKISEDDRVYCGSGTPEYELGLNLSADYAGFDLSVSLFSALGHELMNGTKAAAYSFGRAEDLIYAWSAANPTTCIPAYRGNGKEHPNFRGYTDLWLEDGDFLRVKQITLGYSLPQSIISKAGMSKARIYVTLQNPFTFTNYTGFDPEVGGGVVSRGVDRAAYPVSSYYMAGLNLNF